MIALLIGVASAGYISDLGTPRNLDLPGRHARPFVTDDGAWWLGTGRSGSFHVVPLNDDFTSDNAAFTTIVPGGGEFVDHNFVPCAGGGFLHVASGETYELDDTAWASFVSRDLEWRGTITLIDGEVEYTTNDTPALCAADVWLAGFATEGDGRETIAPGNDFVRFDATAFGGDGAPDRVDASDAQRMPGTALVWHPVTQQVLAIGLQPPERLRVVAYDPDLVVVGASDRYLDVPVDQEVYWSQSAVEVEGGVLIAHMTRGRYDGFAQDTGNVALTLLGPELEVLETVVLTDHVAPDGAMRPGLAVVGEQVVVGYDVGGAVHLVTAQIDREAVAALAVTALPDDDTGVPDDRDSADPAGDDPEDGGPASPVTSAPADEGCASAPAGGPVGLLLLALARRRRR